MQCAVLFEKYDVEIVEYLTDVRNSKCLQITHSWPPTLQQIAEALEAEAERRFKALKATHQPKPSFFVPREIPSHPGCRANVLVQFDAPQYAQLKAWSESQDSDVRDYMIDPKGLRVALSIWNQFGAGKLSSQWKTPTDAELRAYYGKREQEASDARVHEGREAERDFA